MVMVFSGDGGDGDGGGDGGGDGCMSAIGQ